MSRSKWKGPYVENQKTDESKNLISKKFKVLPNFVNKEFAVHNGKLYLKVKVVEEMIDHKFGEFCLSRKEFTFSKSNGTKS